MADMQHHVVPEGFCSAVPCELSKPRTTAKCFPELAQLLTLCLLIRLTIRTEILFCLYLYRFFQSAYKLRDDVWTTFPQWGECVEELCHVLLMHERRSHN